MSSRTANADGFSRELSQDFEVTPGVQWAYIFFFKFFLSRLIENISQAAVIHSAVVDTEKKMYSVRK